MDSSTADLPRSPSPLRRRLCRSAVHTPCTGPTRQRARAAVVCRPPARLAEHPENFAWLALRPSRSLHRRRARPRQLCTTLSTWRCLEASTHEGRLWMRLDTAAIATLTRTRNALRSRAACIPVIVYALFWRAWWLCLEKLLHAMAVHCRCKQHCNGKSVQSRVV